MKKRLLIMVAILAMVASMVLLAGCQDNQQADSSNTIVCNNGQFVGSVEEETGVLAFKGIPYAEPPVGDLRWQAPVAAKDSDEVFNADEFGKSSIQYLWHSEPIATERSEDCLTLNVWTKDLESTGKPIMFFIHGGSFAWGGSSIEHYSGQYIVNEHDDVIVVSCNYRLGMMGFIDLSGVEGGENFQDSEELGLLDVIEALKWTKNNAEAFGGDPDNITIFGESAGSTMVMSVLASEAADGLYNRAICESGGPNLTFDQSQFDESIQAEMLLQASGAKNMDELMALSEEELIAANELELDEDAMTVNDYYSLPLRGKTTSEDVYAGIARAKERGVDVMIGTNEDEIAYWVAEMGEIPMVDMDEEGVQENLAIYEEYFVNPNYENIMNIVSPAVKADLEKYMEQYSDLDDVWARTKLLTEAMFRAPSIKAAESHADAAGEGKTYMYLFGKTGTLFDFEGACHAAEIPYVFHYLHENDFIGEVDPELADNVCDAWVNFAKTGDPSTDYAEWTEYDTKDRNTMVVGDDNSMKMVSDPKGTDRELTRKLADYYIWSAGA